MWILQINKILTKVQGNSSIFPEQCFKLTNKRWARHMRLIPYVTAQSIIPRQSKFFTKIYITTKEKINKKVKWCSFIYYYIEKTGSLQRSCLQGHTTYTKQKSKGIGNRREDLSTYDIIIKEMQGLWLAILETSNSKKSCCMTFSSCPLVLRIFQTFCCISSVFYYFLYQKSGMISINLQQHFQSQNLYISMGHN